jgi:protein TonB
MARSGAGLTGTSPASQRPGLRRKHITTHTRDPKYAAYMDSWVKKVERIGAMNYAERGGKARLTGTLRLDVAINPDGSVAAIELLRSSGNKEIDAAAKRIVRLGEPYAPLPPEIRAETDVLHITRPWRFSDGNLWGGD